MLFILCTCHPSHFIYFHFHAIIFIIFFYPIPWSRQGNRDDPVLTPFLALWYLGMLAANDNGQNAWIF